MKKLMSAIYIAALLFAIFCVVYVHEMACETGGEFIKCRNFWSEIWTHCQNELKMKKMQRQKNAPALAVIIRLLTHGAVILPVISAEHLIDKNWTFQY